MTIAYADGRRAAHTSRRAASSFEATPLSFYDQLVPSGGDKRDGDDVRLLARHSEYGYTDRIDLALPDEPEAVTKHEQDVLSQRSRRDHDARRRAAWKETRAVVVPAIDAFAASVANDRALTHALRSVRRSLEAVSRQVAS